VHCTWPNFLTKNYFLKQQNRHIDSEAKIRCERALNYIVDIEKKIKFSAYRRHHLNPIILSNEPENSLLNEKIVPLEWLKKGVFSLSELICTPARHLTISSSGSWKLI
jgi:hypothetical protein